MSESCFKRVFVGRHRCSACLLILLTISCTALQAEKLALPQLPAPAFADTEVSTNVALWAWTPEHRHFNFTLAFDATSSNNVQIAFGRDCAPPDGAPPDGAPPDGELADEETAFQIGWDCGAWFIASPTNNIRLTASPQAALPSRRTLAFAMDFTQAGIPTALALTDTGAPLAFEGLDCATSIPAWLFQRDWNRLRVTARGADIHDESLFIEMKPDGFMLILR